MIVLSGLSEGVINRAQVVNRIINGSFFWQIPVNLVFWGY